MVVGSSLAPHVSLKPRSASIGPVVHPHVLTGRPL